MVLRRIDTLEPAQGSGPRYGFWSHLWSCVHVASSAKKKNAPCHGTRHYYTYSVKTFAWFCSAKTAATEWQKSAMYIICATNQVRILSFEPKKYALTWSPHKRSFFRTSFQKRRGRCIRNKKLCVGIASWILVNMMIKKPGGQTEGGTSIGRFEHCVAQKHTGLSPVFNDHAIKNRIHLVH
jgi:hypothetical protein